MQGCGEVTFGAERCTEDVPVSSESNHWWLKEIFLPWVRACFVKVIGAFW